MTLCREFRAAHGVTGDNGHARVEARPHALTPSCHEARCPVIRGVVAADGSVIAIGMTLLRVHVVGNTT